MLTWRVDGQRYRVSFRAQAEAKAKRDSLLVEFENLGTKASAISDALRLEAVQCADKLKPYARSLTEAVEFYVNHLEATERSSNIQDMVQEYLEHKEGRGRSKRHTQDLRSRLSRFGDAFPSAMASEVTSKQVDHWLSSMALAPQTLNNFRTVLNGMFNFGVKRGYLSTNPIAGVERHTVVEEAPSILTPLELKELLGACDPRIIPFVAIGAFAGLRSAEISLLDWSEVRLDKGTIEVTSKKAKSRQRRFVKICDALAEWLQPHVKESGPVAPPNLRKLREAAWKSVFPDRKQDNDLRHSYASYHLVLHESAPMTALQLGHGDTTMLFKHYAERILDQSEAVAYFAIKPSKAKNVITIPATKSA